MSMNLTRGRIKEVEDTMENAAFKTPCGQEISPAISYQAWRKLIRKWTKQDKEE